MHDQVQEALDMVGAHLTFYNHTWAPEDREKFDQAVTVLQLEKERNSRKGRKRNERAV